LGGNLVDNGEKKVKKGEKMKKLIVMFFVLMLCVSAFAVWEVGDIIVDDYDWTDSNGEYHSIHELTEAGKVVLLFWGGTG
jgi:hypothetical protein